MKRMSPLELTARREYLGLSQDALARLLDVRRDTIGKWESGTQETPYRIREEIEQLEGETTSAVTELILSARASQIATLPLYRHDAELHAAHPEHGHVTARWWRMVAVRVVREVPGLDLVE
jgi:DNA-binding XRE family transcriptional regulator